MRCTITTRRVHPVAPAGQHYVADHRQKTTAGALAGALRRQAISHDSTVRMTVTTLPAAAGVHQAEPPAQTLPFPTPTPSATTRHLALALDLVGPRAYRMYARTVLQLPHDRWLALDELAAAESIDRHAGKMLAGELVRAGLFQRARRIVNGRDRHVYAVAPR